MKRQSLKHITARDFKLLELLGTHGCASAEVIRRNLWPENMQTRNHFRRLRVLRKSKLIEGIAIDSSMSKGYRLTRKGRSLIKNHPDFNDCAPIRKSYRTNYAHDQFIFDVLMKLSNSTSVFHIKSDTRVQKEIRSDHAKRRDWENIPAIPDGTFQLKVQEKIKTVAIEVELTKKSRKRYEKILVSHLLTQRWDYVIYFCKDDKLLQHLRAIYQSLLERNLSIRFVNRTNRVYFCNLDEFLSGIGDVQIFGAKDIFNFKEFESRFENIENKEQKFFVSSIGLRKSESRQCD